jgi:hypothetical protein
MQEFLQKIPDVIQIVALIGMTVAILATVIVRITPSHSDDEKLNALLDKFLRVLSWLPTIGINPRTKEMEKALEELRKK